MRGAAIFIRSSRRIGRIIGKSSRTRSPAAREATPDEDDRKKEMIELVRQMIDEHGRLKVAARDLSANADLYEIGLTSFAAVQIMLALEAALGVQFPERMLRRQTMSSINSILAELRRLERRAA
jgi:acyl carrier protein